MTLCDNTIYVTKLPFLITVSRKLDMLTVK